jgi:hypothetical protein
MSGEFGKVQVEEPKQEEIKMTDVACGSGEDGLTAWALSGRLTRSQ